jgi:predicted kinase
MKDNDIIKMTCDSSKPTIILLCGCPASGKSTWVRRGLENTTLLDYFKVLSTDIWLEAKAKELNKGYVEIFKDYIGEALEYFIGELYSRIDKKENLIIDQTNIDSISRYKKLKLCDEYTKIGVYFELELQEAIERNCNRGRATPRNILENYYRNYKRPTLEEGFDLIINGGDTF